MAIRAQDAKAHIQKYIDTQYDHVEIVADNIDKVCLVADNMAQLLELSGGILTTKGDIMSYTTEPARLPVGTDDFVLTADSAAASGFSWKAGGAALGGTSTTSHRGDHGIIAHDHSQETGNAHGLTTADLSLDNVDNTSDANKPISTATQTALDDKIDDSQVLTDVPIGAVFSDTVYAHPTTDGNKHVLADGGTNDGKVLTASAVAGVHTWETPVDTTYSIQDGELSEMNFTTPDHDKLDGIELLANNYTHPSGDGNLHVPANSTTNDGKVLTSSDTAGVYTWETPTGGFTSPLTTKGDVLVYDTDNARLPVGSNGQVLIADSAEATGLRWGATGGAPVDSVNGETGVVVLDKTHVGLSNVDNTADSAKPVSTAQQTALDGKIDDAQVLTNVPGGAVFTDTTYSVGDGGLTTNDFTNADHSKLDGIDASANNYTHPTADGDKHVPVTSTTNDGKFLKAGATAGVFSWETMTATDVGLGNVDNTADSAKPVSTAQQTALDGKVDDGQVLTNVPGGAVFTDTTYSVGDGGLTTNDFTNADHSKLDGIAASANNYTHPSGDGNLHVPANSTTNDGRVLTASDTAGVYTWEVPSSGFASPLTTKGDILCYDTTNARLPVGTDGFVLVADSAEGTGLKWQAESGGFGGDIGDDVFRIQDNTDATKEIAFEASGIATSTVRTITMPDANIDLADIHTHANQGVLDATTASFLTADETKLDGIESGATADQTDEEIQDIVGAMLTANTETGITVTYQDGDGTIDFVVDSQTDENFTTADHSKLDGIEASATADQTGAEIKSAYEGEANAFTDAQFTKLGGIATGADVSPTPLTDAQIKTQYELNADTNAFTDADESKLDGIEASATADQTDEEIQDIVGAMLTGNTESGITVTYQDGDGTIDFTVDSQTDENFTTADHSKLDGIAASANNYSHPTGDGNVHVVADGGTNDGKVLTASAVAGVHTWETPSGGGGGQNTTKGDLEGYDTGAARIPVGTNGQVLTADSTEGLGLKWATPDAGSAVTYIKRSSSSTQVISSTPTVIDFETSEEDESNSLLTEAGGVITVVEAGFYRVGGVVTVESTDQRAQCAVEIFINGTGTGIQRGGVYIRNSGTAYDFWAIEIAPEPFSLAADDTIEFRIGQVTGGSYGYGGALVTLQMHSVGNLLWVEKMNNGIKGDTGPAAAQNTYISGFIAGTVGDAEKVGVYIAAHAFDLPSGLTGSQADTGVNPTSAAIIQLKKNGTNIGTINISTGGVDTYTFTTLTSFAVGDRLEFHGQATADTTMADISFTLKGQE